MTSGPDDLRSRSGRCSEDDERADEGGTGLNVRAVAASVGALLGALAVIGGATWVALEGHEVAVIHTMSPDGVACQTRVWIVDAGGLEWVEAATPERPFYRHVLANPRVVVERAGRREERIAEIAANPAGHRHVRELLRAKYGWADRWVALLQDTSQSIAIRLRRPPEERGG